MMNMNFIESDLGLNLDREQDTDQNLNKDSHSHFDRCSTPKDCHIQSFNLKQDMSYIRRELVYVYTKCSWLA